MVMWYLVGLSRCYNLLRYIVTQKNTNATYLMLSLRGDGVANEHTKHG